MLEITLSQEAIAKFKALLTEEDNEDAVYRIREAKVGCAWALMNAKRKSRKPMLKEYLLSSVTTLSTSTEVAIASILTKTSYPKLRLWISSIPC